MTDTNSNFVGNNINTNGSTWTYNYTPLVTCPFKGKCSSEGLKCGNCKNNEYKDYYIPDNDGYKPYTPYIPWWEQPTIWCNCNTDENSKTNDTTNNTTKIDGNKIFSTSLDIKNFNDGDIIQFKVKLST